MELPRIHNDHKVAIARIVDRMAVEGRLQPTAIPEIVALLDFMMSRSDSEFLVNYIRWRMENPIASGLQETDCHEPTNLAR
jgi:hypothetical protein